METRSLESKDFTFSSAKLLRGNPRKRACEFLFKRDGSRCQIPNHTDDLPDPYNCDIDHINGDPSDHRASNLRRTCHSGNSTFAFSQKEAQLAHARPAVRERKNLSPNGRMDATESLHRAVNYQDGPIESQINDNCETEYRDWERAYIKAHGSIFRKEAINSGAEKFGCSTLATRRYQDKLDSDAGPFRKFKDPESRKIVVVSRLLDSDTFIEALQLRKISNEEFRIFQDQCPQISELVKQFENRACSERSDMIGESKN